MNWGGRTIHEFRKTARIISAEPWRLFKAQAYLEHRCDQNHEGSQSVPPQLDGSFRHEMVDVPAPRPSQSVSDRSRALRRVRVDQRKGQQRCLKRPASAEDQGQGQRPFLKKRPASAEDQAGGDGPSSQTDDVGQQRCVKRPASNSASEGQTEGDGPSSDKSDVGQQRSPTLKKTQKRPASESAPGPAQGHDFEDAAALPKEHGQDNVNPQAESNPVPPGCSKCRWSKIGCAKCRQFWPAD